MIDSLNIGKYIYSVLKETDVEVYPLVADNDAKFPFIVYKRNNLVSNGCKDGYYEDVVSYEVVIVTDTYYKGIEIANQVKALLERQSATYQDMDISDTIITMASEEYSNNAFMQKIQFDSTINYKKNGSTNN